MTRVLGSHPLVHTLTWESRFLVDPGGFEDLARALTSAYTPYHAADALERLSWLFGERLTGRSVEAFRGWGLADELGHDKYFGALEELWDQLAWYEFTECVPTLGYRQGATQQQPHEPRGRRRVVGRYFPDRSDLIQVLRDFTDGLFTSAATKAGKQTWGEKTPFNLLSADFLWELFPEARIIVMVRHPRDVLSSHLDQQWAPSTVPAALNWLEPVYQRWLVERPRLQRDPRYLEIQLEEISADWPTGRAELFGALGLPDAQTAEGFNSKLADRAPAEMSSDDQHLVTEILGPICADLGYD